MEENKKEINRLLNKLKTIKSNHKGSRKGFTLVELLVVIAIVAILGTVSVVAYLGFVNSANISNDDNLVTQLNTYLKAKETLNGKPATYYDMENILRKEGYVISEMNTFTDGARYAWNSEDNQLVVLDKNNDIIKPNESVGTIAPKDQYKYFVSTSSDDFNSTANFSHYLRADYSGSNTLDVITGLDVGNSGSKVTSISYKNGSSYAKNVVIRSNSGETTLNVTLGQDATTGKWDTLKHYGDLGTANIIQAGTSSYHEFGKTGFMEITAGHVVVEKDAEVVAAWVDTANASNVTVEVEGNIDHAHAASDTAASTLNGYTDKGNVTWDYDGNTAQNSDANVYHHVTDITGIVGDKIGSATTNKSDVKYEAEAEIIYTVIVDGKYYKTLQDAFDKAPKDNGGNYDLSSAKTIVLLKDLTDGGLYTPDNHTISGEITINLNGHTYTAINGAGSSGTPSQAMHFGCDNVKIIMKNGNFVVGQGTENIKMALQGYSEFEAINVNFDFTNIPLRYYGVFDGVYAPYSNLECPLFNLYKESTLTNCTLLFNSQSNYGLGFSNVTLNNTTINCSAFTDEVNSILRVDSKSSITKGVVSYFKSGSGKVKFNQTTSDGYTVYTSVSDAE